MPLKATIQILNGPLLGRKFSVDSNIEVTIGRSSDAQIIIPHGADTKLSRLHCKVTFNLPQITIVDLESSNGTYIDDERIAAADISSGSILTVGDTKIKFLIVEPVNCIDCGVELADKDLNAFYRDGGIYLCDECFSQLEYRGENTEFETSGNEDGSDTEFFDYNGDTTVVNISDNTKMNLEETLAPKKKYPEKKSFDQFEILCCLAEGGMGSVYKAKDLETGEIVALKMMHPSIAESEIFREDFLREIENTKILSHPNIVNVLNVNISDSKKMFFTMEYCDCGSIQELVESSEKHVSIENGFNILKPCLLALDYAHNVEIHNIKLHDGRAVSARGLVHRDIKPGNILLANKDGGVCPKIADFGLAKAFDHASETGNTMVGAVAGAMGFVPRQQVENYKFCKPEVDVWAMAATYYYMLTKCMPRDFDDDMDDASTVLHKPTVPIRKRRREIPKSVAEVIDLALIDTHDLFYKNANDFLNALQKAIEESFE